MDSSSVFPRRALGAALTLSCVLGPALALAQPVREIRGRAMISREAGPVGAAGAWVVLHRVARDSAGPIDSVRAAADGGFRFRARLAADDSALVFASMSHHGIAYFSSPVRARAAGGPNDEAEIVAFDTSSAGPPLVVRGRHVIVQRGGGREQRAVVEVFDIENPGPTTRVGVGDAPTFTFPLPLVAQAPRAATGDVAAEAMRFAGARGEVLAPIAPGVRQIAVVYGVEVSEFPLRLEQPMRSGLVEVMIEDSTGTVSGAAFGAPEEAAIEQRRFRRWTAQEVPAGGMLVIGGIGGSGTFSAPTIAALAFGIVALIGIGLAAQRRRETTVRTPALAQVGLGGLAAVRGDAAEQLARRIAALDRAFAARGAEADEAARTAYEAERAALKDELTQVLAANRGGA